MSQRTGRKRSPELRKRKGFSIFCTATAFDHRRDPLEPIARNVDDVGHRDENPGPVETVELFAQRLALAVELGQAVDDPDIRPASG
jgi:hypothetical protein